MAEIVPLVPQTKIGSRYTKNKWRIERAYRILYFNEAERREDEGPRAWRLRILEQLQTLTKNWNKVRLDRCGSDQLNLTEEGILAELENFEFPRHPVGGMPPDSSDTLE
jgi:hypothetical protein